MRSYIKENARYFLIVSGLVTLLLHVIGHQEKPMKTVDMKLDIELDRDTRYLTGRLKKKAREMNNPETDHIVERTQSQSYVTFLEDLRGGEFTPPATLENSPGYITLGFIFVNLEKTKELGHNMRFKVSRTLDSMMTYSSGGSLHFIVITDLYSQDTVRLFLSHFISKRISEGVILNPTWRWRNVKGVPPLKISLVDLEEIAKINYPFIEALKRNTEKKEDSSVDKYSSDLFYIGPLYYKAFEKLDRLLFIDITDLDFFSDITELYDHFENTEEAIMGVGLDMSPHYRKFLKSYLMDHPESALGSPGRSQGFNTGVVLYRLDNMRANNVYQKYLQVEEVDRLIRSYKFNMTLGDQDWFTELGWDHPELFYILPCHYNAQTSIQYLAPPWEETFDSYHYCDQKVKLKIVHRNGCGPMPQACGYTPSPTSTYWKDKKSFMHDISINMETLWDIMAELSSSGSAKFKMFHTI